MTESPGKQVTIYTDGGCRGNPGPGGYGVVLISGQHRCELSGGFRLTTNNRMELLAAICGLESLKSSCDVTVYSDATYVVTAMQKEEAHRWRAQGWKRKGKGGGIPVKNPDLWQRLLESTDRHRVAFRWVKGHANVMENERCDRLAVAAATSAPQAIDEVFEQAHPELKHRAVAPLGQRVPATQQKVTRAGEPCPKCGVAVETRKPKRGPKPGQTYYYAYYLACPGCGTNFMIEAGKRNI